MKTKWAPAIRLFSPTRSVFCNEFRTAYMELAESAEDVILPTYLGKGIYLPTWNVGKVPTYLRSKSITRLPPYIHTYLALLIQKPPSK